HSDVAEGRGRTFECSAGFHASVSNRTQRRDAQSGGSRRRLSEVRLAAKVLARRARRALGKQRRSGGARGNETRRRNSFRERQAHSQLDRLRGYDQEVERNAAERA